MLAGTDDHLTWLSPVILNLENMGLTHLESEIRVPHVNSVCKSAFYNLLKSESMGAPGRRATCYLSDFDETWPV